MRSLAKQSWLIGINRRYGAGPNCVNNSGHDSDTVWHSIHVPHAGTVALEQLDGTPAGIKKPYITAQPTMTHSQPLSGTATTPVELILTRDRKCKYTSPDGKLCGKNSKRNGSIARHWFERHAMRELKAVRSKKLSMSDATIINTVARKLVAERYLTTCPLETCVFKGTPSAEFLRQENLVRHMNNPNLHRKMPVSKTTARNWARNNMALWNQSNDFANGYEEAIWRICHGY